MKREEAIDRKNWMSSIDVGFIAFDEAKLIRHINKIYDDLEHRTCESCKYCIKDVICEGSRECEEGISFIQSEAFCLVEGTDGCNRWKQK